MLQNTTLLPARKARNSDDNMIPLINIVFLLLIFFMVAGQIKAMPNADLILPKALLNEEDAHSEMRLEVAQQGTLTLDGTPCTPEELATRLQALSDHAAISVGIFADQRATAASLEQAMAVLRQYSFQSVRLYAEAPEGNS